MKILFFLVHPAKFNQFRITINKLKQDGHEVDLIITGRDILEELVINEGWPYKKIFPQGRKLKNVHVYISAGIFLIITVFKLLKLTSGKKYNLYVSDDLLNFVGRIRGVPSILITDDDLSAVPESWILMAAANYILAPDICELGKYNEKKLGYFGYKSLAHLHPNQFKPLRSKITSKLPEGKPYYFIRTVSATSTHDVGNKGISDELLDRIVHFLEPHGNIIINSERTLPDHLKKFQLPIVKNDVSHYLAFAQIFISDSTTMCVEAAVLGTPSVEIDDWHLDFKQYHELHDRYELLNGFFPGEPEKIFTKLSAFINDPGIREKFNAKRMKMLQEKIDVSSFIVWLIENQPGSFHEYFADPGIQKKYLIA
jgi:predicted glycosyltransferase